MISPGRQLKQRVTKKRSMPTADDVFDGRSMSEQRSSRFDITAHVRTSTARSMSVASQQQRGASAAPDLARLSVAPSPPCCSIQQAQPFDLFQQISCVTSSRRYSLDQFISRTKSYYDCNCSLDNKRKNENKFPKLTCGGRDPGDWEI